MTDTETARQIYITPDPEMQKASSLVLESIGLFADSFGLQPFTIIVADSNQAKSKIALPEKHLSDIPPNSMILIFAVYSSISKQQINDYIDSIAKQKQVAPSSLNEYRKSLIDTINSTNKEGLNWSARQASMAIEKLQNATAGTQFQTLVIKDFNKKEMDAALNVTGQKLTSFAIVALYHEKNKVLPFNLPPNESHQKLYQVV